MLVVKYSVGCGVFGWLWCILVVLVYSGSCGVFWWFWCILVVLVYSVEEKLQTGEEWAQLGGKVMSIKRFNEYVLKQRISYQILICNPSSSLFVFHYELRHCYGAPKKVFYLVQIMSSE